MKAVPPRRNMRRAPSPPRLLESLEPRALLSASFTDLNHPHYLPLPGNAQPFMPYFAPGSQAFLGTVAGMNVALPSHAAVRWDNGQVTTVSFVANTHSFNLYTIAPRLPNGVHGIIIAFWQTTKAGQLLSTTYASSYVFFDLNTANGLSATATAGQTFNGKVSNIVAVLPDALNGVPAPVTVPTPGATDGSTSTFKAIIDWGDGSPASIGTLLKNLAGKWELWGTHTYARAGTYKIQSYIERTNHFGTTGGNLVHGGPSVIDFDVEVSTITVTASH